MKLFLTGALFISLTAHGFSGEKITLTPDMMTNMSGVRPALELIDEQELAGDPLTGNGGNPATTYSNGFINQSLHFPLAVVFDFQTERSLTDIWFYDANGDGPLRFDAWDSALKKWSPLCNDDLTNYKKWIGKSISANSRYLRINFDSPNSVISELIVYGAPNGKIRSKTAPEKHCGRPQMESFIGLNGFIDDPIDRLAAGGHVREYHSWQWDAGNDTKDYSGFPADAHAWSPSWVSGPGWGWDFDAYYKKLREANIVAAPVFQGSAPFVHGHTNGTGDWKPSTAKENPEDPASYLEHASYLFQFAARYGSTSVPASMLKLREGQPVKSGLGLVSFMENWNEPDRTWSGREGHFQPSELAAMMSADYDGHLGVMGPGAGVKNADPKMKFVMAGLAFPEIEYLKALKLWSDLHRDGSFPADVINLHHYSNNAGGQSGQSTCGISPEDDHLREKMTALVQFRDTHYPEKEIWLSEFGYDTHASSPQRSPAIGKTPAEEVQAWWLMRSYLALAAAGIDRAQMFMLRDVDASLPGKFNSSGLTGSAKEGHPPKPAWHRITTMRRTLTGTRFEKEIPSGRDDVLIYRFKGKQTVDVLWCPTSEGKEISDFTYAAGKEKVLLKITECPSFLILD